MTPAEVSAAKRALERELHAAIVSFEHATGTNVTSIVRVQPRQHPYDQQWNPPRVIVTAEVA